MRTTLAEMVTGKPPQDHHTSVALRTVATAAEGGATARRLCDSLASPASPWPASRPSGAPSSPTSCGGCWARSLTSRPEPRSWVSAVGGSGCRQRCRQGSSVRAAVCWGRTTLKCLRRRPSPATGSASTRPGPPSRPCTRTRPPPRRPRRPFSARVGAPTWPAVPAAANGSETAYCRGRSAGSMSKGNGASRWVVVPARAVVRST